MILTALKIPAQLFCRVSLHLVLSYVFSRLGSGYASLAGISQNDAVFSLHPIRWHMILICSIKVRVNFENLNEVVSARLLHHFFSLSISIHWRASLRVWKWPVPHHTFILFIDWWIVIFSWNIVTHLFTPISVCTHNSISFSGLLFFSNYHQMWPGKSLQDFSNIQILWFGYTFILLTSYKLLMSQTLVSVFRTPIFANSAFSRSLLNEEAPRKSPWYPSKRLFPTTLSHLGHVLTHLFSLLKRQSSLYTSKPELEEASNWIINSHLGHGVQRWGIYSSGHRTNTRCKERFNSLHRGFRRALSFLSLLQFLHLRGL